MIVFRTAAMLVNLTHNFFAQLLMVCLECLHTKFLILKSSFSLFVTVKSKDKNIFRTAAMLLFSIVLEEMT
jgi:hypothetical protein